MTLKAAQYRSILIPLLILIIGFGTTALIYSVVRHSHNQEEHARFMALSEKVIETINDRLNVYVYGLRGVRGLFISSEFVTHDEFKRYVASCDLPIEFPGALGFGYIERVPREQLADYVQRVRADRGNQFVVHGNGSQSDVYVIRYIEPLTINIAALGFDISSDPMRREAAEQSMLTGQPTITGRTTLMQDGSQRPGFLYLLPHYRHDMPTNTPEQRREALRGWVYAPLIMDDIMRGVVHAADNQIDFEVFDGHESLGKTRMFDADGHLEAVTEQIGAEHYKGRRFFREHHIAVGGREWTVWLSTRPEFNESAHVDMLYTTIISGVVLTLIVAGVVAMQGREEIRAQRLALKMTRSLREHEEETRTLAMVASKTTNGVELTDHTGHIVWVNDAFTRITGYSLDEVKGKKPGTLLQGAETDANTAARIREAVRDGRGISVEILNYTKAGRQYWNSLEIQPIFNVDGNITHYMGIQNDVTERKLTIKALKESEARFRAAIEGGFDAFYLYKSVREDAVNINDFEVVDLNQRAAADMLMMREQIIGRRLSDLMPKEAGRRLIEKYIKIVETGRTLEEEVEEENQKGHVWLHHQAVRVGDGVAVTIHDITDRKCMEQQLRLAAETDRLTGLPNRAKFTRKIDLAIAKATVDQTFRFAVLFLDFDRFKQVNDTLGHEMGDQLLIAITGRLRSTLRFGDRDGMDDNANTVVARLGGDEFVVLLCDIAGLDDAQRIAQRLLENLNHPYAMHGQQVHSTASIGLTMYEGHESAEQLVRHADAAMYAAKTSGKAKYVVFDASMLNDTKAA